MTSQRFHWLVRAAPIVAIAAVMAFQAAPARPPVKTDTFAQRASTLVKRMTLDEKASQLRHDSPAITRLGIPAYNWWSEGLHGVARAGNATVFPQAIGLAATWDTPLMNRSADVISTEFRAKYLATRRPDGSSVNYGGLTVWSPNVNIFRDPRWGRGQETYGEDPYLTSRMAVAFIRGLQGTDPDYLKTISVVKHFAVHSGPESARHHENVTPSAHDLEDTYLPAFRAAITEGGVMGVMCAYNAIDGKPACASPLLAGRIRNSWGFKGHIVSDCDAIADFFLVTSHRYTKTPEEAAAAALNAGTDLFCARFGLEQREDPQIVVRAVRAGLVSEAVLDRAVARLIEARLRLGLIDPPATPPFARIDSTQFDTPDHHRSAMEAARASMVLLHNDGLLPLRSAPARIAVIGPNADNLDALVGNYNGDPSNPVTVLSGLRQRFPDSRIDYVEGTGLVGPSKKPGEREDAAIEAARGADLVVFVGGLTANLEGEEMPVNAPGFAGGDRTSLDLPAPQQALLERLHQTGKPVVLVLMNGSPLSVNWADRDVGAIVEAWYPGGDGGRAVADLIAGDFSPSGRLPVTFYRSADQLPSFEDYRMAGRTYRYFPGEVLYPFGYGLSYTRFSYAKPVVRRLPDRSVELSVDITNSGDRDGAEVAEVYTAIDRPGAPIRALQGFQRVFLKRGETRTLRFALDDRRLSYVDPTGQRLLSPGPVRLWVGGGQPVSRPGLAAPSGVATSIQITESKRLPL